MPHDPKLPKSIFLPLDRPSFPTNCVSPMVAPQFLTNPRHQTSGKLDVSAVMPCLNEAGTLGLCIGKAKRRMEEVGLAGEVVVADNGSVDGSEDVAASLGARVVHESQPGYGAALRCGILAARGEIVVMADSDDSYDWGAIEQFVEKIREGFDLVVGNRFKGQIEPGAMPFLHRYLGNPVLSLVARLAFHAPIGDFHCGMRAFRRDVFDRMQTSSVGMEFATEMIAGAMRAGLRVTEIPVRLAPDKRDRPPHLRSFRDGWRHLRFIVTYAPDHLYMGPGAVMLAVGLLLQMLLAGGPLVWPGGYMGIHFLVLGGVLSVLGLNVLLMGILAKSTLALRYGTRPSTILDRIAGSFRLERMLALGLALFLCGFVFDAFVLLRWLRHIGVPMEDTVHPVIVATNMIALGANVSFGAFLLHLMIGETSPPRRRDESSSKAEGASLG